MTWLRGIGQKGQLGKQTTPKERNGNEEWRKTQRERNDCRDWCILIDGMMISMEKGTEGKARKSIIMSVE